MSLRDIIEGAFALRELKKQGLIEDDGLSVWQYIKLGLQAEKNVRRGDMHEDKQSEKNAI